MSSWAYPQQGDQIDIYGAPREWQLARSGAAKVVAEKALRFLNNLYVESQELKELLRGEVRLLQTRLETRVPGQSVWCHKLGGVSWRVYGAGPVEYGWGSGRRRRTQVRASAEAGGAARRACAGEAGWLLSKTANDQDLPSHNNSLASPSASCTDSGPSPSIHTRSTSRA